MLEMNDYDSTTKELNEALRTPMVFTTGGEPKGPLKAESLFDGVKRAGDPTLKPGDWVWGEDEFGDPAVMIVVDEAYLNQMLEFWRAPQHGLL